MVGTGVCRVGTVSLLGGAGTPAGGCPGSTGVD